MTSELDVKLAALDYRRCRVRVNGQLFELDRDNPAHLAPDLTSDPPGAERDLQPTPKSSNQRADWELLVRSGLTPVQAVAMRDDYEAEIERLRGQLDAAEQHVRILREQVASFAPAHETSPDPKGLAVVRAAQLDLAAKTLDRHDCHVQGEACREAAQLLREFAGVRAENGTSPHVHRWVLPEPPVTASNHFCGDCGFFPGPPVTRGGES